MIKEFEKVNHYTNTKKYEYFQLSCSLLVILHINTYYIGTIRLM